ncbi:MAG: hypothetical protein ACRDZT_01470 [Acidimicrobiales bacterium]
MVRREDYQGATFERLLTPLRIRATTLGPYSAPLAWQRRAVGIARDMRHSRRQKPALFEEEYAGPAPRRVGGVPQPAELLMGTEGIRALEIETVIEAIMIIASSEAA